MDPELGSSPSFDGFKKETWKHTLILSFQSLGVVFGRLSTAPLYVYGTIPVEELISSDSAYQYFSFIFWALTIITLLKYAIIVLRADDDGEGGPFALYSLLCRHARVGLLPIDQSANEVMHYEGGSPFRIKKESRARRAIESNKSSHYLMLLLALFGACMMIGDAVLTPAISVLSASSGLQRSLSDMAYKLSSSPMTQVHVADDLDKYVPVSFACAILVCLFTLQHYGTHKIGFMFAPIIIIWLLFIGGVGLHNIVKCEPKIISAVSPVYMYRFIRNIDKRRWRSLGSVLLCIAGSEALFADLGHFSKKSIQIVLVSLIYPVLILCYAGQAAFISKNYENFEDFNHLSRSVPELVRHVFVVLSLLASVVGSQASLTGSFSIIKQCLALRCFPRVKVVHTSDKRNGQVYIPDVNWLLMVLSLTVTIGFHDAVLIGNAAGLAIVSGMLVTSCLMSLVIALYWEKSLLAAAFFLLFFGFVEAIFLSACILNFHRGPWSLVVIVALSLTIMLAWHYGTMKKYEFDLQNKVSTEWLTDYSPGLGVARVPGIGFIFTDIVTGIPAFFSHFITNLPAFHRVLIFVSFKSLPIPHVPPSRRYLIGRVGAKTYKIFRCIVRHGYCDHIRDTDDFEEQIIRSIAEFISQEENDLDSLVSSEVRMIVVGNPSPEGNAIIPVQDTCSAVATTSLANNESLMSRAGDSSATGLPSVRKKMVRFTLPANCTKMNFFIREELQELIDAQESGTAYFQGRSHLTVRKGSSFLKRFLTKTYAFCDKNCRAHPVALNIPHAALVEVGMVYTI